MLFTSCGNLYLGCTMHITIVVSFYLSKTYASVNKIGHVFIVDVVFLLFLRTPILFFYFGLFVLHKLRCCQQNHVFGRKKTELKTANAIRHLTSQQNRLVFILWKQNLFDAQHKQSKTGTSQQDYYVILKWNMERQNTWRVPRYSCVKRDIDTKRLI